jgi:hypothetical protein
VYVEMGEEYGDMVVSSFVLNNNGAIYGKDIYLVCEDLVSVVPSLFSSLTSVPENARLNSFWGVDDSNMNKEEDMFFFFTECKGSSILITSTGTDDVFFWENISGVFFF